MFFDKRQLFQQFFHMNGVKIIADVCLQAVLLPDPMISANAFNRLLSAEGAAKGIAIPAKKVVKPKKLPGDEFQEKSLVSQKGVNNALFGGACLVDCQFNGKGGRETALLPQSAQGQISLSLHKIQKGFILCGA